MLHNLYSLQSILSFSNIDVSSTKMCLDTSIFMKGNMGRTEYYIGQINNLKIHICPLNRDEGSSIFCTAAHPEKGTFHNFTTHDACQEMRPPRSESNNVHNNERTRPDQVTRQFKHKTIGDIYIIQLSHLLLMGK
jgi:hypothetical protein